MNTIKVNKNKLLEKLEQNRTAHEAQFKTALEEWVQACTEALEEAASRARVDGVIEESPLRNLPKPVRFSDEYENAIQRVQWSEDDELELDDRQFAAWIQDNWDWSRTWVANTSTYLAASAARG